MDDSYSGGTTVGLEQLSGMIDDGLIGTIIVRICRLGETIWLICIPSSFPNADIRFIAINNGVDSISTENDMTPFINIFNEFCKDKP